MSKIKSQKTCPHCGAALDPKNQKTRYLCGWPLKPLKCLDPQKFHEQEKAIFTVVEITDKEITISS